MTRQVFEFVLKDYGFVRSPLLDASPYYAYTSEDHIGLVVGVCQPIHSKKPAFANLKTGETPFQTGLTPAELRKRLEQYTVRKTMRA